MARWCEFNRLRRGVALAVLALALAAPAHADDIKKWRDADGNLHYSVTGGEGDAAPAEDDSSPVVQGRQVSTEETFSVEASLHRKEIETKLVAAAKDLDQARKEIAATEAREFRTWVPTVTGNPAAAQASLDAQRDAFLAAQQFEERKAEELRRLRRRERAKLKEIVALWKEFSALDGVVTERYGTAPDWWRKRLSCGNCPSLADAERTLAGPKTPPGKSPDDEDWEDDEDWQ